MYFKYFTKNPRYRPPSLRFDFPRNLPHDKNPVSKFSYWHLASRFRGEREDDFYLKKISLSGLPRIITRFCFGRNFAKSAKLKNFFFSVQKCSYWKIF
jgi:hypothetical protein